MIVPTAKCIPSLILLYIYIYIKVYDHVTEDIHLIPN